MSRWGPLLIAEEALHPPSIEQLGRWMGRQPLKVAQIRRLSIVSSPLAITSLLDALALARIVGLMGKSNRQGSLLLADNATLTDLRGQPATMIGASATTGRKNYSPAIVSSSRAIPPPRWAPSVIPATLRAHGPLT